MRRRIALPAILIAAALVAISAFFAWQMSIKRGAPRHVQVAPLHRMPAASWVDEDDLPTFPVIRLREAMAITAQRFDGRIIAAELVEPTPAEAARGVQLAYALRLLTPARDVLTVRLDARDGTFLDAAGHGLTEARRHGESAGTPKNHRRKGN